MKDGQYFKNIGSRILYCELNFIKGFIDSGLFEIGNLGSYS